MASKLEDYLFSIRNPQTLSSLLMAAESQAKVFSSPGLGPQHVLAVILMDHEDPIGRGVISLCGDRGNGKLIATLLSMKSEVSETRYITEELGEILGWAHHEAGSWEKVTSRELFIAIAKDALMGGVLDGFGISTSRVLASSRLNADCVDILTVAQKEAEARGHREIGIHHLAVVLLPLSLFVVDFARFTEMQGELDFLAGREKQDVLLPPCSGRLRELIEKASEIAGKELVTPEHLFEALLDHGGTVGALLRKHGIDRTKFRESVSTLGDLRTRWKRGTL